MSARAGCGRVRRRERSGTAAWRWSLARRAWRSARSGKAATKRVLGLGPRTWSRSCAAAGRVRSRRRGQRRGRCWSSSPIRSHAAIESRLCAGRASTHVLAAVHAAWHPDQRQDRRQDAQGSRLQPAGAEPGGRRYAAPGPQRTVRAHHTSARNQVSPGERSMRDARGARFRRRDFDQHPRRRMRSRPTGSECNVPADPITRP